MKNEETRKNKEKRWKRLLMKGWENLNYFDRFLVVYAHQGEEEGTDEENQWFQQSLIKIKLMKHPEINMKLINIKHFLKWKTNQWSAVTWKGVASDWPHWIGLFWRKLTMSVTKVFLEREFLQRTTLVLLEEVLLMSEQPSTQKLDLVYFRHGCQLALPRMSISQKSTIDIKEHNFAWGTHLVVPTGIKHY